MEACCFSLAYIVLFAAVAGGILVSTTAAILYVTGYFFEVLYFLSDLVSEKVLGRKKKSLLKKAGDYSIDDGKPA